MQTADLQASLGFLQAIHLSAKNAKVNKKVCQTMSTVVGRLRPCLEEVDMVESDQGEQSSHSLRLIENGLEKIHVVIKRFSTMGYLQSVLEAQACHDNFTECRDAMTAALEKFSRNGSHCSTQRWEEDVKRICERLSELQFDDCNNLQLAKTVHATSRRILDGVISEQVGQENIRKELLASPSISPTNMQQEIQGLERELSRARVEKEDSEVKELEMIIRALKQSSSDSENDRKPRPPVEYLCPISRGIMKDPVVLVETGQTYDRKYIEEWFERGNRTCPATKLQISDLSLSPNYALKSLASTWIDVNPGGSDWVDDDSSIVFPRSALGSDSSSEKKLKCDMKQQLNNKSGTSDGYSSVVECAYSRMDIPSVEQVLSSSVDLTSVLQKDSETCSEIGSRTSSTGKARTASLYSSSTTTDDPKDKWKTFQTIDATKPTMQKFSMENSRTAVATPKQAMKYIVAPASDGSSKKRNQQPSEDTAQRNGISKATEFANRLMSTVRNNPKFSDSKSLVDVLSTASGVSDLRKRNRRSSLDAPGLQDVIKVLRNARQLQSGIASDDKATGSTRSAMMLPICGGEPTPLTHRSLPHGCSRRPTQNGDAPYNANQAGGERECDLHLYDDMEQYEIRSDDGTEQHPTDEAEGGWFENPDFDTASLTTIGSGVTKYAKSMMSVRPTMKKGMGLTTGFMQGATNVMFDEDEGFEDGTESVADQEETTDVSLPVLAGLLKGNDPDLLASSVNDLAVKAHTDPSVLYEIPRTDIIPSLVKLLDIPSNPVKAGAARAIAVIVERNPEARVLVLNSGAVRKLSALFKQAEETQSEEVEEGSVDDIAGAMRYALDSLSAQRKGAPSVDVSTPMLVDMLVSPDDEMQASALLDLQEKMNSVNGEVVLKELANADILMNLVDALEHQDEDVQLAASDILSRLIFHDQKTQRELSQSIGIVSKLLRLVKKGGEESTSCRSAAAQVLRGLAHNNSKIREDILKRGVVPDFASLLCSSDGLARETAAWMLGILASHSKAGQDAVFRCDQAMFMLYELASDGLPQEKVAAKFALRSLNADGVDDEVCELSGRIVIDSLTTGCPEMKVAAAWELCRMASNNQWSQLEIYENGGVSALLTYLKARPCADGMSACLATLVKLASCEAHVAAQISQEDGVAIAVKLLKSHTAIDKKLVIHFMTVLAEKCPLYQQEIVSNGAVPVLVEMMLTDESISKAAYEALSCMLDTEMSDIHTAVAEMTVPSLLECLKNTESVPFGKKPAIQLLAKMGQASYDCHECIVRHNTMEVIMECLQNEEDPEILLAATQAKKSLPATPDQQSRGDISRMVQALGNSTRNRTSRTPGMVQLNEHPVRSQMSGNLCSVGQYAGNLSSRNLNRKTSFSTSKVSLPAVMEYMSEGASEKAEGEDTASVKIESPDSPRAPSDSRVSQRRSFEQVQKQPLDIPAQVPVSQGIRKEIPEVVQKVDKRRDYSALSTTSSNRRPPSHKGSENDFRRPNATSCNDNTDTVLVDSVIKELNPLNSQSTKDVCDKLRDLNSRGRAVGSAILRSGGFSILMQNLHPKTCR